MGSSAEYAHGEELLFAEIEPGTQTPRYDYLMSAEAIRSFATAVGDTNPIHLDEAAARDAGFDGLVAPPATVAIYSKASNLLAACEPKRKPPPGAIHTSQVYEFTGVVIAGDVITSHGRFLEKTVRNGRRYVCIETVHENQHGERIARGEISVIWPK